MKKGILLGFLGATTDVASAYKKRPRLFLGGAVIYCFGMGVFSLMLLENKRAQQKPPSNVNMDSATKSQNEALAEMLVGLKHKTFREKLEAAADAQDKFMAPENSKGHGS